MDRVPDFESVGCRFKSCWAHHSSSIFEYLKVILMKTSNYLFYFCLTLCHFSFSEIIIEKLSEICKNGSITSTLDDEYSAGFTTLLETVYGEGFLSQGSLESVDYMFKHIDLNNKMILDIGSGLGGVEIYLAKKYSLQITGIDPVLRLVTIAKAHASKKSLSGTVNFKHITSNNYPFENDSFDIVFAKESLLHVENKKDLFKEIFRILKPGGQVIILDWITESHVLGKNIKEMMETDNLDLKLATKDEYLSYFAAARFEPPAIEELNEKYIGYTKENIQKIQMDKDKICKEFDEKTFDYSLRSWNMQLKAFEEREILCSLFTTRKPENTPVQIKKA